MRKYIKNYMIKTRQEITVKSLIGEEEFVTYNPSEAQILADGWEIYDNRQELYEDRVAELIRVKYTFNQELAILRQRDSKPEEFAAYNAYAEECKSTARKEIFGDEPAS